MAIMFRYSLWILFLSSFGVFAQDKPSDTMELYEEAMNLTQFRNWPGRNMHFGPISSVCLDPKNENVYVLHRSTRIWDAHSFDQFNVFTKKEEGAIVSPTVAVLSPQDGTILTWWGANFFFLPHGITVDLEQNLWITDVAMHQVFKFPPLNFSAVNSSDFVNPPVLTLGQAFTPGVQKKFCKPTSVAVLTNKEFFVSDGYCNNRIIKFSPEGEVMLEWGRSTLPGIPLSPYSLSVPHDLTLAENKSLICAADRENGRVQCYDTRNGTYRSQVKSDRFGSKIYAVSYTPAYGGKFLIVNGPNSHLRANHPAAVFASDMEGSRIWEFSLMDGALENPHDIVVSKNGSLVYVVELQPYKIWKLFLEITHPFKLTTPFLKAVNPDLVKGNYFFTPIFPGNEQNMHHDTPVDYAMAGIVCGISFCIAIAVIMTYRKVMGPERPETPELPQLHVPPSSEAVMLDTIQEQNEEEEAEMETAT